MGFYIRKSIRMGPVRLNLSKSGLGVSTGVTGFRVGMNGRGTYVHMGRGGLYYRKQLSWTARPAGTTRSPQPPRSGQIVEPGNSNILFTENLAQPLEVQSTNADEKALLAHFRDRKEWTWLILFTGGLGLMSSFGSITWTLGFCLVALMLFLLHVRQAQRDVLIYDLDDQAIERFQAVVEAFSRFFCSKRMWLYEERTGISDWKRNAGATELVKRRLAVALPDGDPRVRTNISIPCLSSGAERIFFLPDTVVVRNGSSLGAYRYADLEFTIGTKVFIEEQGAPSDAQIVGQAWRFSRRDGGPDGRFSNNRQYPKCLYQSVQVALAGRFRRELAKSSVNDHAPLRAEVRRLSEYMSRLQSASPSAPSSSRIVT